MIRMLSSSLAAAVLILAATACSETTPKPDVRATTPAASSGQIVIPPPPAGSGRGAAALVWELPEGWMAEPPSSPMRKAQFRVEGPGGAARCAVFYFGPGQGGDPMANFQRWAHQFQGEDGTNAFEAMKISELEGARLPVRLLEIHGSYHGAMGSGPSEALPHQMLLGAIADGPDAPWFFKFTGPEKTVSSQREAFETLLRSLHPGA